MSPKELGAKLCLCASLLAAAPWGCAARKLEPLPQGAEHALLRQRLPSLRGLTLDGRAVKPSGLHGKIVVVKFFAKYCVPCQHTLPELVSLAQERGDIAVIGVAEDAARSDVESMIRSYGLSFAVMHDREQTIAGRFRVTELPVTFIADQSGSIRWVGGADQRRGAAVRVARALADDLGR